MEEPRFKERAQAHVRQISIEGMPGNFYGKKPEIAKAMLEATPEEVGRALNAWQREINDLRDSARRVEDRAAGRDFTDEDKREMGRFHGEANKLTFLRNYILHLTQNPASIKSDAGMLSGQRAVRYSEKDEAKKVYLAEEGLERLKDEARVLNQTMLHLRRRIYAAERLGAKHLLRPEHFGLHPHTFNQELEKLLRKEKKNGGRQ